MLNGLKGNMNGKLKFLSDEDCEEIHYSSLEVLEETGLKIESKDALDGLSEFGCEVDSRTSIVKFPGDLVEECLKNTPSSVKLYGNDPKYDIKIGRKRIYASTSSGYGIIDRKTDLARDGLLNDVAEGTLVAENLENIHSIIPPLAGIADVPHEVMTPLILSETLKNTHKSVEFYLTGGASADKDMKNILDLCKIVAGSESELEKRPFLMFIIDPLSPLTYTGDQIEALFRSVDAGLPIAIMPGAQGGGTAPVTLAGMLVQTNAEFLGGVVLANLIKMGAPVLYGHTSTIMHMRTGVYTGGAVEMGILGACVSQLGAYYNVPTNGYYPMSDSHIPDQQVGYEKTMQWVLAALSGMNYVSGAGNVETATLISLEQMVIDNEIIGMIDRMLHGVQIDEQRLAVSVIGDIGPGGMYLKHPHTRNWMGNEYYSPKISEKSTYSEWEKKGKTDVVKRARDCVETILKNEESPVEKDLIKDIELFQKKLLRQK